MKVSFFDGFFALPIGQEQKVVEQQRDELCDKNLSKEGHEDHSPSAQSENRERIVKQGQLDN